MSVIASLAILAPLLGCAKQEASAPDLAVSSSAPSEVHSSSDPAADPERPRPPEGEVDRRMVIREAHLDLRAAEPTLAGEKIAKMAEAAGGYVVSSKATGNGEAVVRVDVTLRVPADKFQPTLAKLRALGKPLNEEITGKDVTEEYVDIQARIHTKRELEQRLLAILAQSATVDDSIKVEIELGRVRTDIETMEGRAKYLEDRTSMATIAVSASSPNVADPEGAESVWSRLNRAMSTAVDVSVDVVVGIIVVLGALVPIAIAVGLLIGLIVIAVRVGRRRRNKT